MNNLNCMTLHMFTSASYLVTRTQKHKAILLLHRTKNMQKCINEDEINKRVKKKCKRGLHESVMSTKKVGKFCLHGNPIFSVTTFVTKQTMLHYIKHTFTPPFTHTDKCALTHTNIH